MKFKISSEKYEILKINNSDSTYLTQKFAKDLPEHLMLERKGWGNVWAAFNGGNFRILFPEKINTIIDDFSHSHVYLDLLKPVLHRIDDIKQGKNPAFSYQPVSLVFRVSYKCNIECRHCYNSSNGKETDCIAQDTAIRVITEAYHCGVRSLGLTGGEVMLFPELVLEMVSKAANLGYEKINLVTNAYWGKTPEKAKAIFKKFYQKGLKPGLGSISISAGEFHHEFLEWNCHKNVILANHEVMGTVIRVDFEHVVGNEKVLEDFKNYLSSHGIKDEWYKLVVRTSLASVGRWKENQVNFNTKLSTVVELGSCEPTTMLTIEPTGDVFPCCGFNRNIKGLVLGNVNSLSISQIIANSKKHVALQNLYHHHMHEIQEQLKNHMDLPEQYSSICESCESFFGQPDNLKFLKLPVISS